MIIRIVIIHPQEVGQHLSCDHLSSFVQKRACCGSTFVHGQVLHQLGKLSWSWRLRLVVVGWSWRWPGHSWESFVWTLWLYENNWVHTRVWKGAYTWLVHQDKDSLTCQHLIIRTLSLYHLRKLLDYGITCSCNVRYFVKISYTIDVFTMHGIIFYGQSRNAERTR